MLPPVYRPSIDFFDRNGPGVIRSHRNSAAPLSNRDLIYITFLNAELFFYMVGLLDFMRFERVDNLGAYLIPSETGLLIPSVINNYPRSSMMCESPDSQSFTKLFAT